MNILYFTTNPPGNKSGGSMVCKQSLISLSGCGSIDYIGPSLYDEELKERISNYWTLNFEKSWFRRVTYLVRGVVSGYYKSWRSIETELDWSLYDLVYIESTLHDFVAKIAYSKGKKVIIRAHNVEQDYYRNLYRINKSMMSYLRYLLAVRQEKKVAEYTDSIICLSEEDKKRMIGLYKAKNVVVYPVSIQDFGGKEQHHEETLNSKRKLLITGSLWYGPNEEGIIWFVENVWDKVKGNENIGNEGYHYHLVIAGANPTDRLKDKVMMDDKITLVESPESTAPLFNEAFLYIAPIFSGAGMKVKVAEAISFALPVIGTEHAFVGYKIDHGKTGYIANEAEEFIKYLLHYGKLSIEKRKRMKKEIRELFYMSYHMDRSCEFYRGLINTLSKG